MVAYLKPVLHFMLHIVVLQTSPLCPFAGGSRTLMSHFGAKRNNPNINGKLIFECKFYLLPKKVIIYGGAMVESGYIG